MAKIKEILEFFDGIVRPGEFADFGGAYNGLQVGDPDACADTGLICCAVDAGYYAISKAAEMGAGILLVHHGLFWRAPLPITGANYSKIAALVKSGMLLYSAHLPLDAHSEYGNNALIARELGLDSIGTCFPAFENDIGSLCRAPSGGRAELESRLRKLFPNTFKRIAFGPEEPVKIAICSGSAAEAVEAMPKLGIDTMITGEVKEHFYELARDIKVNLYPCGHYATETFGVKALCKAAAEHFGVEWTFIDVDNPL